MRDIKPVVVVTGASAGVGRATALAFAKRGYAVALLARGIEGLEGARRDIEGAGGQALIVPTDVASPEQVEAAAAAVEMQLGPIDIWINNAMVSVCSPAMEITPEEFRRVTDVTYLGAAAAMVKIIDRIAAAFLLLVTPFISHAEVDEVRIIDAMKLAAFSPDLLGR